jgi:catechol 2,3-dioxygenase-like lactoylglutathione lyase family enzyme
MSRRHFLAATSAVAVAPWACAQDAGFRLRKLNTFEIRVSNVDASMRFYQDLFGMPALARSADRASLRIGDGPQNMVLRALLPGETTAIAHLGYSVENFDVDRCQRVLRVNGFEPIEPPPRSVNGLDVAMKSWIRLSGETRELYFADARGLIVQLTDPSYCGGSGVLGNQCETPASAGEGLMRLTELNHFTAFVNDGAEANRFYQELFGLSVQAYQGPQGPVTGIGDGYQFVMYAGGPSANPTPANIHHGCFNMLDFDVDRILAMLTDYGLSARGDSPVGPLMHYVSLRMPERGGAEGGTPEVYFTDPDGILMQLQDVSYCGGGGYLGSECLAGD